MKKLLAFFLPLLFISLPVRAEMPALSISAKSAILMEASTGRVLFSQNIHEPLPPASVTKIMTMLLIMEAIDAGQISYDTIVVASENAKRMGGSTIFLDTGEEMCVHDLLKGIAVASGNDACVAMAEHLAGSEEAFVNRMNERAAELGMENTHFKNCNGLDEEGHETSAYDIALMSRALLSHPDIFQFTTIWVDSLRGGAFGLANTNKLIRFYSGANGLKTGSTDDALYCLSATAERDGMQLIAVVLGAPSTKERFDGARALLDAGFATYSLLKPENTEAPLHMLPIEKGTKETVPLVCGTVVELLVEKAKAGQVETRVEAAEKLTAPVEAETEAGKVSFYLDGTLLGEFPLVTAEKAERKTFGSVLSALFSRWCTANHI